MQDGGSRHKKSHVTGKQIERKLQNSVTKQQTTTAARKELNKRRIRKWNMAAASNLK
jgi:hypothetical protein